MNIEKLVSEMTFEQKVGMLSGRNSYTHEIPELDIPKLHVIDGPNGIRKGKYKSEGGCTCIPCAALLGASWDGEASLFAGEIIADDCLNEEEALLLAPGVNMKRTPFCGRNFEYFAEDPVLAGEMAAELINGLDRKGIGASLKHYAVNNQELDRTFINAEVDERTLREYYLKAFEVTLKNSKPDMVMTSYNKVCGIWASENSFLLKDILRDEFGYEGVVIPDWGAVHDIPKSIHAGLDLVMAHAEGIEEQLREALEKGTVTMEDIDQAVTRVLQFVERRRNTLTMEKPGNIRQMQHEKAEALAAEGMVLLKNEDNILPITGKKYKKIAVYGQHAQYPVICGSGAARVDVQKEWIDAPIDFIKKYAEEEGIELSYSALNDVKYIGAEIVAKINNQKKNEMDMIVIFAGNNYGADTETEYWDRENLTLPNYMTGMIKDACAVCDNVVVVLNTGSAITPPRRHEQCKGMVTMWYPGEGGGKAIADILFGKVNPSGKLSETFPMKAREDMDVFGDGYKTCYTEGLSVGYRYYDRHPEEIWFPFGHGLSYTNFAYSDLRLDKTFSNQKEDELTVRMKVKNTGDVSGKEIVQLYLSQINSVVFKPVKELKRYAKVELAAGEETEVVFTLSHKDFAYYNICLKEWHVESGTYEILLGASSRDIRLKDTYKISYEGDYTIGAPKGKYTMA